VFDSEVITVDSDRRGLGMDSVQSDRRSVEVCREFIRQRCDRSEDNCRFAHPPSSCHVINGRVTCCVDSIKV